MLATGLLALEALRLPIAARFEVWRFADYGANLTVHALLDQGLRPTIDFFYPYGLLPVAIGRVGFALAGRSPAAYLAAVGVLHVLGAWAIARIAVSLRIGWTGTALAIAALPLTFPPTYPNLAHGLEAVLIAHALAEIAAGRLDRSLVLTALAALTKPSMAYVLGALVVGALAVRDRGRGKNLLKSLRPLMLVAVPVLVVLAGWFGVAVLVRTQWPGTTADLYRSARYGFFRGIGRDFWLPPQATWRSYLGTARGYWLAASAVLVVVGVSSVPRVLLRGGAEAIPRRAAGVVGACALLHVAFVAAFFGGENSWLYYAYLLTIGLMASVRLEGWRRVAVAVLAGLAVLSGRGLPREAVRDWRAVDARIDGLWTSSDSAREWSEVRRRLAGPGRRPVALLAMSGCAEMVEPELFLPPVSLFLLNGMDQTIDARRKADQLRSAATVLVPKVPEGTLEFRLTSPAFRAALAGRRVLLDGRYYRLYGSAE